MGNLKLLLVSLDLASQRESSLCCALIRVSMRRTVGGVGDESRWDEDEAVGHNLKESGATAQSRVEVAEHRLRVHAV